MHFVLQRQHCPLLFGEIFVIIYIEKSILLASVSFVQFVPMRKTGFRDNNNYFFITLTKIELFI